MPNVRFAMAQRRKLAHKPLKDNSSTEKEGEEDQQKQQQMNEELAKRRRAAKIAKNIVRETDDDEDEEDSDEEDASDEDNNDGGKKKHQHKKKDEEKAASSGFGNSQIVKIVSLILLIPIVMSIPFVLSHICIFVEEKLPKYTIEGIWCIYIPIMLFFAFYLRRGKTTLESFATHNMIYLIIALGIYNFMHVAQSVPLRYRRNALKLWLTITNVFNIIAFLIDDTDYKAQEEKEKAKERRKEERRKKREEERALKKKKEVPPEELPFYKRNKVVKVIFDLVVYAAILAVIVWIGFAMKRKYEDFTAESQKTWGYEGNTGADWKHDLKEDDLQDVHVAEAAPEANKEETNNY